MKLILVDIDGVLTDGRVTLDINGDETKSICYRDLDAISIGRKAGYDFAFVTGEDTEMVHILVKRFGIELIYAGAKDKLKAMWEISNEFNIPISGLLYIGDTDRDAPALEAVGLGIAPSDASACAKAASHVQTESKGGCGVLLEIVEKLISGKWRFPKVDEQ